MVTRRCAPSLTTAGDFNIARILHNTQRPGTPYMRRCMMLRATCSFARSLLQNTQSHPTPRADCPSIAAPVHTTLETHEFRCPPHAQMKITTHLAQGIFLGAEIPSQGFSRTPKQDFPGISGDFQGFPGISALVKMPRSRCCLLSIQDPTVRNRHRTTCGGAQAAFCTLSDVFW